MLDGGQGDQKGWKKNAQNLEKVAKNSCQAQKCQNIYIKAQFISAQHQHKTTFETKKYLQQTLL